MEGDDFRLGVVEGFSGGRDRRKSVRMGITGEAWQHGWMEVFWYLDFRKDDIASYRQSILDRKSTRRGDACSKQCWNSHFSLKYCFILVDKAMVWNKILLNNILNESKKGRVGAARLVVTINSPHHPCNLQPPHRSVSSRRHRGKILHQQRHNNQLRAQVITNIF